MPAIEVIKSWKDEEYRDTLTLEEKAQLPEHPSGLIEFGQPQLADESLFGPGEFICKFSYTRVKHCFTSRPGHCK
jgi:mersacidin/lichenicidin family type 2 lantibiotic